MRKEKRQRQREKHTDQQTSLQNVKDKKSSTKEKMTNTEKQKYFMNHSGEKIDEGN